MNQILRSFFAGVGSVLSIAPVAKCDAYSQDVIEVIGSDFERVGEDIYVAIERQSDVVADEETRLRKLLSEATT